jgi:hypothetical protein
MHILIGLAVATLLIIGICVGNLFACVFLSLLPAAYLLLAVGLGTTNSGGWALACVVLLCVIWGPRYLRIRASQRVYRLHAPPAPKPPMPPIRRNALLVSGGILGAYGLTLIVTLAVYAGSH